MTWVPPSKAAERRKLYLENNDISMSSHGEDTGSYVLAEPSRAVPTEIVLREDGEQERREYRGVDTNGQVPELGDENGCEDGIPTELRPPLVEEVEGDRETETGDNGPWNPLERHGHYELGFVWMTSGTYPVATAWCVERLAESTPGDGTGVVRLNLLSTPDAGTLDVQEDVPVGGDDDPHDDEV